jgi:hypothetical protein
MRLSIEAGAFFNLSFRGIFGDFPSKLEKLNSPALSHFYLNHYLLRESGQEELLR